MIRKIMLNEWMLAFCFVAGIMVAGADGPWFPWINFAGIAVFTWPAIAVNILQAGPAESTPKPKEVKDAYSRFNYRVADVRDLPPNRMVHAGRRQTTGHGRQTDVVGNGRRGRIAA